MRTFSIQSFGCRVNQAESFEWAEKLQAAGFSLSPEWGKSDLIIVNTCALTAGAERDVRKFLRQISRCHPQCQLVVTGCAVKLLEEELERNKQVKAVVPNEAKPELLTPIVGSEASRPEVLFAASEPQTFRSRALVKIQDGCSQACTFCVIPQVRGKNKSRPADEIIRRVKQLTDLGYREIVLAGIHLTSYGAEQNPPLSLLQLLRELTSIDGLGRLRLSSLDPRAMDEALVDFLTSHEKICPHFHLSLQHASEPVLRLMGRKSQTEDYRRILVALREKSPQAALGADIIVGFPGERETDFRFLKDFIAVSPLTYLHVFPYSPRPGTVAARWPQLPGLVKKERAKELRGLALRKNLDFRNSLVGQVFSGIVIRQRRTGETEVLTNNYVKVMVSKFLSAGQEVKVRIGQVKPEATFGEVMA
jgi:threonylcarbamoyladenosine tRNA methylthiotransferase MtaB